MELLGHLRLSNGEIVHTRFYSQKTALLLATLAYFPRRVLSREEIIESLWPDSDTGAGRASLRSALASLRRQLEPPGTEAGGVLTADHTHISLNPLAFTTDVAEFEKRLDDVERQDVLHDRLHSLQCALDLYAGDLLPGFYEDWILLERERLRQRLFVALETTANLLGAEGEFSQALTLTLHLLRFDALHEAANSNALRWMVETGQRDAAQRHYTQMVRLFAAQLQLPPPPLVQKEVQRSGLTAQTPPPTETVRREVRARSRPPVVAPTANGNANAPILPSTTRLRGRESELKQLKQVCFRSEVRLITLTGTGGVGKSRLALELAQEIQQETTLRVVCVPLAEVFSEAQIADAIVSRLGVSRLPRVSAFEQATDELAKMPTLLLLDNFEHLREGEPIVSSLLRRLPDLKCLLTSRQRLQLPEAIVFPLEPLPVPTRPQPVEVLLDCSSVQLFADRARLALPDFQITSRNAPAITEICIRLEGLPLAIELAAARLNRVSPSRMSRELQQRLPFLTGRAQGGQERHRTLRMALDWSYRLLAPELQRLFCSLAVFRGGWTADAAKMVGEQANAADALEELVSCSLLTRETCSEETRYAMLETIREFAGEKLQAIPENWNAVLNRHRAYFLDLAEVAAPHLTGSEQKLWLDRLERDHNNFRAILRVEGAHPVPPEEQLQLATALWRFWYTRSLLAEGREWLSLSLARAPHAPLILRAKALAGVGRLAWSMGDYAEAIRLNQESLTLSRKLYYKPGIAAALSNLGLAVHAQGNYEEACRLHQESLSLSRELNDKQGIAGGLNNLAIALHEQHQLEACVPLYEESIRLFMELGNKVTAAVILTNLGILRFVQGNYEAAQRLHEDALALKRELGDKRGIAYTLNSYGTVLKEKGEPERAVSVYRESISLFREIKDKQGLASSTSNYARLYTDLRDGKSAVPLLKEAFLLWKETGLSYKSGVSDVLEATARAEQLRQEWQCAARLYLAVARLRQQENIETTACEQERLGADFALVRQQLTEAEWNECRAASANWDWNAAVAEALLCLKDS